MASIRPFGETIASLDAVLAPINRAGWPFIAGFAAATVVLWWLATPLGLLGVVLTLWCTYFFRDPSRVTPSRQGLIISPADGVVQAITAAPPPPELDMGDAACTRVSVFMNVFDVHVNRIPVDGVVTRTAYHPGKFFNASLDKASEHNERQGVVVTTADGVQVAFVQIAGLIARRIKCVVNEGQAVRAGERYGLIRFGSRVDVYLPDGVAPLAVVGQRAIAGETVIADLRAQEAARGGERR